VKEGKIDLRHPYLTRQIIAYIGNKRRLLPLIQGAIARCYSEPVRDLSFFDPFSGSGVVSRFARLSGFRVFSNDWEYYSYVINRAFLGIDKSELEDLYREHGGLEKLLEQLNNLPDPSPADQYIARHYSPSTEDPEKVDFRRERMFYTRRNGLTIDKIRHRIEELYPEGEGCDSPKRMKEKLLLIALLLYESATHSNTSGVFKAYHKGFGGHGGDALPRIMAPIGMQMPVLINARYSARIYCEDAQMLVDSEKLGHLRWDIVYLDPPYNQHQYGSNYHLLNTIARWDRPPVDDSVNEKGVLKQKAAIRKDWVRTRSDYCYRDCARKAFSRLLGSIDAEHILLSYSTEGIIPFEELLELCIRWGEPEIITDRYTKYRGGKQSINRLNRNVEFVLIIHRKKTAGKESLQRIKSALLERRIGLLMEKKYSLDRLAHNFSLDRKKMSITLPGSGLTLATRNFFEIIPPFEPHTESGIEQKELARRLADSACRDKGEELEQILRIIGEDGCERPYFIRKIPETLKKFAHKKYRQVFLFWLERVKGIKKAFPELYALIKEKVDAVETLAWKRFEN
jgi:adenine-specific DNA-methyltransferase